jgi:uncharacterized protein (UPF0261 family)
MARIQSSGSNTRTIALLGALDTKGAEFEFLKREIEQRGHRTLVIDAGVLAPPPFSPDVSREDLARAAGAEISSLIEARDRGAAVATMGRGAEAVVSRLYSEGRCDAIIGMGGSAGTAIGTQAMRALPLGVPKVMVSTLAGGDVTGFVGVKDIVMIPTVVDISGLNRISRRVLAQAAGAICGMAESRIPTSAEKALVSATMFGNTTDCVERARARLEQAGYEVLVFHATGTGGRTMESLVEAGDIAGVLDVTTTEWADELIGGVLAAGASRLEAAARSGTPAVIAPGCLDMVNFWAPETVPQKFAGRRFYPHNPNVTLMRTTPEENAELGRLLSGKLNISQGPVAVYLPLRGISMISAPGGPFYWPEADAALFDALRRNLRPDIPVYEIDANINDPVFADTIAQGLIEMLESRKVRETV